MVNPDTATDKKVAAVQWLRAIAAVMVTVQHATFFSDSLSGLTTREMWGFSSWAFGIHIFFVVSGFIMICSTRNYGSVDACRAFFSRRLVRVVPLYWLMTSVMVAGVILSPHSIEIAGSKIEYILGSYFFIPIPRTPGDLRPILGQGWTLQYEMFFYLSFAIAVLLPRRTAVLALTVAFSTLAWLGRDLTSDTPILFRMTDGLILEFLLGIFIGLAFEKNWRVPGWFAAASVLAGAGLVIMELQGPTFLIAGIPAALIVGGFVLGPRLPESFATVWLTRIGDASYSLYLVHILVLNFAYKAWVAIVADRLPASVFLGLSIAASVVAGLLLYRFIERPMTEFLQQRLKRRKNVSSSRPTIAPARASVTAS